MRKRIFSGMAILVLAATISACGNSNLQASPGIGDAPQTATEVEKLLTVPGSGWLMDAVKPIEADGKVIGWVLNGRMNLPEKACVDFDPRKGSETNLIGDREWTVKGNGGKAARTLFKGKGTVETPYQVTVYWSPCTPEIG